MTDTRDLSRFAPENLAKDTTYSNSVDMDWSDLASEDPDRVDVALPTITVEILDEYFDGWADSFPLSDFDDDEEDRLEAAREAFAESDRYYEWKDSFWPMMNYAYPINTYFSSQECADNLDEIAPCLSLVTVDDQDYLALTGGGMNLAWDICAAFIACGCVPPTYYLRDLPAYASGGKYRSNLPDDIAALVLACVPVVAERLRLDADRLEADAKRLLND